MGQYIRERSMYFHKKIIGRILANDDIIPKSLSWKDLCQDEELKAVILQDMNDIGKQAKLAGYERISNVLLENEPWSIENDLLTPTFKIKRNAMCKKYKEPILQLYRRLNEGRG